MATCPKEASGETEAAYVTAALRHILSVATSTNPIAEHVTPLSACESPSRKRYCGFVSKFNKSLSFAIIEN